MNLIQLGQLFQQTRLVRGLTQEEILTRSQAYKDERSLRAIEAGETRPKRPTLIALVVRGLDENDRTLIDQFLSLAGYEPLREREAADLGLTPLALSKPPESEAPPTPSINIAWLKNCKAAIVGCLIAAAGGIAFLQRPFLVTTAVLYSTLYAISVFLESVYDYRGSVTVLAALLSFSMIWVTSTAALWAETVILSAQGLWIAISLFMFGALAQWLAVRPALSSYPNVPAGFQPMTGRTAHLKNSGYFLVFVFSFWAVPVHCVACQQVHTPHPVCPPVLLLWSLLVGYFGAALYMAHVLLTGFRNGPLYDRYLTLFLARAILGLFLSVICLLWYSSAMP